MKTTDLCFPILLCRPAVLIHLSIPSPSRFTHPPSTPATAPYTRHSRLINNWQLCWNHCLSPRQSRRSAAVAPLTKTQLTLNSVPAFILFILVAAGTSRDSLLLFFMQTYSNLASAYYHVYWLPQLEVLFLPFHVFCFLAFAPLCLFVLCFDYCTCSKCTWEQHSIFTASGFCVMVLFTSCKREEGSQRGGVQWLPGEEEVVSNEVTPWQPGDSSHSASPCLSYLSTWPRLRVPTHSTPPSPSPYDRESSPWCWKQKNTSSLRLQCSCERKTHETNTWNECLEQETGVGVLRRLKSTQQEK